MNPLSQEHPNAWPWGVAMYTNLHYQQYHYEKEHLFEKALTPSDPPCFPHHSSNS